MVLPAGYDRAAHVTDPPAGTPKILKNQGGSSILPKFRVFFFYDAFQGGTFCVFEVLGTPKMEQKHLKIVKKSSQVAPGAPLGGENVIL